MSTAGEIVRDALMHLGVMDAHEAVEAQDMSDGIRVMNMMLRRWEANGLALGWNDVSSPDDLMPSPPEADEAIGYSLAVKLRARYGVAPSPDVFQFANDGYAVLLRDRFIASPIRFKDHLPYGGGAYNIYSDTYE